MTFFCALRFVDRFHHDLIYDDWDICKISGPSGIGNMVHPIEAVIITFVG